MRRLVASVCLVLAATAAAAYDARPSGAGVDARGSLAWLFSDDLDLAGDLAVRVVLVRDAAPAVPFVALATTTTIVRSVDTFTFQVRDVAYDARAGAAVRLRTGRLIVVAGQRGSVAADTPGDAWVRYAGVGWESSGFAAVRGGPVEGRAEIAAVVDRRGVDADARVAGAVRWSHPGRRVGWGLDLTLDALVGDGALRGEWTAGPRLDLPFGEGRRVALFARALRSRHPLGFATRGVLLGFEGEEARGAALPGHRSGDVRGLAGIGAGPGTEARLTIEVVSASFAGDTTVAIEVDARARRAAGIGDLYYLYTVGFERPAEAWRWGAWFYHRSDHVLSTARPGIPSFNVLEAGAQTRGWNRAPAAPVGPRGRLDARLRAGFVVNATDDSHPRWNVRGGVRWIAPLPRTRVDPYLAFEIEAGHARSRAGSVGLLLPAGADLRLEVRRDGRLSSPDRDGVTLWGAVRF